MIEAQNLTKRYGEKTAVDDLTFTVKPGMVTGFLGPNGSGKSTTMRLILGLDAPSGGDGDRGREGATGTSPPLSTRSGCSSRPARCTPAARPITTCWRSPRRTGSRAHGCNELISLVGLDEVARKRAGQFSLGMGQRLGIAAALLGDPEVLILDEPINGLDPEGIRWIRDLLKGLAAEGRTVFLSSHLMSEMAVTADHLIIIGRGRLIRDVGLQEFVDEWSTNIVRVRSPRGQRSCAMLILGPDVRVSSEEPGLLEVDGPDRRADRRCRRPARLGASTS